MKLNLTLFRLALVLCVFAALPARSQQQQWGTWTPGRGAFGDWRWASPRADAATILAITGVPGECIAAEDTGPIYCWSLDTAFWVGQADAGQWWLPPYSHPTNPGACSTADSVRIWQKGAGRYLTKCDGTNFAPWSSPHRDEHQVGGADILTAEALASSCGAGFGIIADGAGAAACSAAVISQAGHTHAAGDVTGSGTASRCARFNSTHQLVEASADCPAGDTANAGDVVGPPSSADNAVCRFDSTTGRLLQGSVATLGDGGALDLTATGNITLGVTNNDLLLRKASTRQLALRSGSDGSDAGLSASDFFTAASAHTVRVSNSSGGTVAVGSGGQEGFASATSPGTTLDTFTTRAAAGVRLFHDALQLSSRTAPPVTCSGATEGTLYADSDSKEVCYCDGTSWVGLKAAGACA